MRLSATRLTSIAQAGGGRTLIQRAIAVLRRFGPDAHIYLPGVGMLNGLQAGNYLDYAGTQPGEVDQPVGLVLDATGGIHAQQPTTSAKPILRRGAVNLLTYSGDFSNAAWAKVGGAFTGQTFTEDASTGGHLVVRYGMWSASQQTAVYRVKHVPGRIVGIGNNSAGYGVFFDLNAGVVLGAIGAITGTVTQDTDGYYIVTATHTAAGAQTLGLMLAQSYTGAWNTTSTHTGDGVSSLTVTHGGLFAGTYTAAQIQALGGIPLTTTAPASTALGPYSWGFDGSNDSLSLGGPLFQMADDHCVIAGGLSTLATGDRYFLDHGSSASTSPMVASLALAGTLAKVYWRDDANVMTSINGGFVAQGSVAILSARKVSTTGVLRVNGQQVASAAIAAGATTLTGAAIGTRMFPANMLAGQVYPVIAIKGTASDSDLLLLEKWVGSMSGATIL